MTRFYRKTIVTVISGIVLTLIAVFGIVPLVNHINKPAYLDIWVAPGDAVVMIDDARYSNAIYTMEPGSYAATVSGDGMSEIRLELDLVKNQTTGLYLVWDDTANEWRQYDNEAMAKRNSIGGIMPLYLSICGTPASRMNCDAIAVQYGRSVECDNELCLAITGRRAELTDEVLELVRNNLNDKGYNLDDYRYFYRQNDTR